MRCLVAIVIVAPLGIRRCPPGVPTPEALAGGSGRGNSRTYKSMSEPSRAGAYDFINYFECANEDVPRFHEVGDSLANSGKISMKVLCTILVKLSAPRSIRVWRMPAWLSVSP
jgi:hypothetical protein